MRRACLSAFPENLVLRRLWMSFHKGETNACPSCLPFFTASSFGQPGRCFVHELQAAVRGKPTCRPSRPASSPGGRIMTTPVRSVRAQLAHKKRVLIAAFVGTGIEWYDFYLRSEEHTAELQSRGQLVCRLLLEHTNTVSMPASR